MLLGLLLFFSTAGFAQKTIQVVLLAGQSNMVGHGNYDDLDSTVKERIKRVADRVLLSTSDNPEAPPIPLSYYISNGDTKFKFSRQFGPELFIGLTLAEANPTQKYLMIKKAVGGTSLYGAWNPEWSTEKANLAERGDIRKKLKLYQACLSTIKNNLQRLKSEGIPYEIIGMAWMQGESDTHKEITASHYKENLKRLIAGCRKELHFKNMPFVIGEINTLPRKFNAGPAMVRAAMEEIANADKNIAIVKTSTDPSWSDYPKHTDNLHYNAEGQERLGIAFAHQLMQLTTKNSTN